MNANEIIIYDFKNKFSDSFYIGLINDLHLSKYGIAVIKNFPNESDEILSFANLFGNITIEGRKLSKEEASEKYIYEVKYRADSVVDEAGMNIYSSTNAEIELHTDSSYLFNINPPDYLFLHAVKQSEQGGETILFNVSDILKEIPSDVIQQLMRSVFPFRFGFAPILFSVGLETFIRYNFDIIDVSIKKSNMKIDQEAMVALKYFHRIISSSANRVIFKLATNDMLIINNYKNLHGRHSFDNKDLRILKRLRITSHLFQQNQFG